MSVLDKFLDAIRLNDDFDDDDEFFDDDELEAMDEEKPKRRFFKKLEDDFDDEDDEEPAPAKKVKAAKTSAAASAPKPARQPKASATSSSKITPMRGRKVSGGNMEVCVIKPASMEDTREIADTLLAGCTVILNLEGIDVEVAQRIIDFCCGSSYCLNGGLQKVSGYIFILTPSSVEISGDIQDLLNGAFDIPSIRTDF